MARPTREDPETMRAKILESARQAVVKDGPDALSVRAIARELGYSAGSLYRHFDGRDAIIRALREGASHRMRARFESAGFEEPDEHPLVALGLAYIRICRQHPDDMTLAALLRERTSLDQAVPSHSPYGLVLDAVTEAVEGGEFAAPTREAREAIAYGVWALVQGMVELQRTHLRGFDADLDRADRFALRALVRGFCDVSY